VLITGAPAQEIVRLAVALGADLLVSAATPRRGLARLLAHTGRWISDHPLAQ